MSLVYGYISSGIILLAICFGLWRRWQNYRIMKCIDKTHEASIRMAQEIEGE